MIRATLSFLARLIATTVQGLEDIAAAELAARFGCAPERARRGAVTWWTPEEPGRGLLGRVAALNHHARGIHRVGVLLAEATIGSLTDAAAAAAAVDLRHWVVREQRIAVRPSRSGELGFRSPELGARIGDAVIGRFREQTGHRLPVDLDDPDLILKADAVADTFRLWIDTTGNRALHERTYRLHPHRAPLNASLAWLLLRYGGWAGEDLLDPMCGSATLPIEAALAAEGIPPGRLRKSPLAWRRLRWGEPEPALPEREAAPPELAAATLAGVDRSSRQAAGARQNAAAAGVGERVRIAEGDAAELGAVRAGEGWPVPGLIAVNPPFGRRVGSVRKLETAYRGLASSAAAEGVGRLVALAEDAARMRRALDAAGYRIAARRRINYGALDVSVLLARLA